MRFCTFISKRTLVRGELARNHGHDSWELGLASYLQASRCHRESSRTFVTLDIVSLFQPLLQGPGAGLHMAIF